jgi:hypothetical protein
MAVFQGGVQTLVKTKSIYFEICDEFSNRYGTSTSQLLGVLIEFGFFLFMINEDYKMLPVDQSFVSERHHQNIIATRDVNDLVRRTGWVVNLQEI